MASKMVLERKIACFNISNPTVLNRTLIYIAFACLPCHDEKELQHDNGIYHACRNSLDFLPHGPLKSACDTFRFEQ